MKDKDIHIRISAEKVKKIEDLATKDQRKKTKVIEIALDNYFKARKI